MRTQITVFHNVSREAMLQGYRPGHNLRMVFCYALRAPARDLEAVLEEVYHDLNVGDDPAFGEPSRHALEYRALAHRSLSVGDVIMLDALPFSVDSCGFTRLNPCQRNTEMEE